MRTRPTEPFGTPRPLKHASAPWNFFGKSIMDEQPLPEDLREFLKLLNSRKVEFLLIGGYAVAWYGYPRATADLDIWVAMSAKNAAKLVKVLREFGFDIAELTSDLFLEENKVVRLGEPPLRIEILTSIDGVDFEECYRMRNQVHFHGLKMNLISLAHLKKNKAASGRLKDLDDLEHLP